MMAEGGIVSQGDERLPFVIDKAWETLRFEVLDRKTRYEYDATKEVPLCKLQFVLKSDFTCDDFFAQLEKKFVFKVISPGFVRIETDWMKHKSVIELWATLVSSVNQALQRLDMKDFTFISKQECETALLEGDDNSRNLLRNGLVGVYISCKENACIAKCIGSEQHLKFFSQGLMSTTKRQEEANIKISTSTVYKEDTWRFRQTGLSRTPVLINRTITSDEVNYLHIMNFENHLQRVCPLVKYEEMEDDNNMYKVEISSPEEKELQHAIQLFDTYLEDIQKEEISLPQEDIMFLSNKNVKVHLQINLRLIPAYLQINTESVIIWCKDENKLEKAKEFVYGSYVTTEIEGKSTPEALCILKEGHGKIQISEKKSNPQVRIVRYTLDQKVKANELVEKLHQYRHREQKKYSQENIKAMIALGILEDLKEGFKDVSLRVCEEESVVTVQGSALDRLAACLADLDVNIQRIKICTTDFLSESAKTLLQNSTVCLYVQRMSEEKVAFIHGDGGNILVCMVCMNRRNVFSICSGIKNCFVEMKIDKECLENAKGKQFLAKHFGELTRKDFKDISSICFTRNLIHEVEELLSCYSKSFSDVFSKYLLMFGADCLQKIEKKHLVKAELQPRYVCFQGPYHNGKKAMAELESSVETVVVQGSSGEFGKTLLSSKKNLQLNAICKNCKCSWNAVSFSHERSESTDGEGIEYLCTWKIHENNGQVAIAKIDYKTAELDALIIPVNESLYGEDILVEGTEECSYSENYNLYSKKLVIGESRPLKSTGKLACKNFIGLVVSAVDIVDQKQLRRYASSMDLQKYCAKTILDLFDRGLYRIGFALPRQKQNLKGKLNAIVEGYQSVAQFYDGLPDSELLFGVKSEAEWVIQEADNVLKYTTCTKRQISPKYYGLLSRPQVSVKVSEKSVLDVGASCIVAAVSADLDLSKGFVSNLINEACGSQLQEELDLKYTECLRDGEVVIFDSFDLSKKGIRKLIFGVLPLWTKCKKSTEALETFVQDCLLLADAAGCSTLAFPHLGTGKSGYPMRDVSVALLEGIDRYVSEGTIGGISDVYIAAPNVDDNTFLEAEQERRRKGAGKHPQIDDQEFLFAQDNNVKYIIVNENTWEIMSSGKFVNVIFIPERTDSEVEIRAKPFEIVAVCGNTKDDLKEAVSQVICLCENRRITSVNVFCTREFSGFSEADQTDTIIETVYKTVYHFSLTHYASRVYKYLTNVTVVTSNAAFSTIKELKIIDKAKAKENTFIGKMVKWYNSSNTDFPLHWKIDFCTTSVPKQYLNVILVGGEDSDLEKAKLDIRELLTTEKDEGSSVDKVTDQVSAELNSGIVKYLTTLPEADFQNWKSCVSAAFMVQFTMNQNRSKIELFGTFSNILRTEQYLEDDFPDLPCVERTESEVREWSTYNVSMSKEEVTLIRSFFKDEVHELSSQKEVVKLNIFDDAISVKCKPAFRHEIESKIRTLQKRAEQIPETTLKLDSKEELSAALQINLQKGIILIPNESTNSVRIIGKEHSLIQKVGKEIHDAMKKMVKREAKLNTALFFQKASFRLGKLDLTVMFQDITDLQVDCVVSNVNGEINTSSGVAKSVAKKAGKRYLGECKAIMDQIGQLDVIRCFRTDPGNLKCKHVLHTHCPITLNKSLEPEHLTEFTLKKCLETADQLELKSIAIPFHCSEVSGLSSEQCASAYFKAVSNFQEAEYLQDIYLVDMEKEKVSQVCHIISKCMDDNSMGTYQSYAELLISNSMSNVKCYIAQGEMHSVSSDAVVLNVDENFRDRGEDLNKLLACSSQMLKNAYAEQRKVPHGCTTVTSICAGGGMLSKYVLFAVSPEWDIVLESYQKQMRITMLHILQKAEELACSSIALPIFHCQDDVALAHCCQAMVESVLQFCEDSKTELKLIQFLSTDKVAISRLSREMALQLGTNESRC